MDFLQNILFNFANGLFFFFFVVATPRAMNAFFSGTSPRLTRTKHHLLIAVFASFLGAVFLKRFWMLFAFHVLFFFFLSGEVIAFPRTSQLPGLFYL